MVEDALAEGGALLGVVDRDIQRRLGEPGGDRGDPESAGVEGAERDAQPVALLADEAVGAEGGAVPVCAGGGDGVEAHLLLRPAETQALRLAGGEEAGDAA